MFVSGMNMKRHSLENDKENTEEDEEIRVEYTLHETR